MPSVPVDLDYSTLAQIQIKVRRLTRTPSTAQLLDNDLNNYINTFVLYDFPQTLKLFPLRKTLTFYTNPNVEYCTTNLINPNDPLFNFQNQYMAITSPVYVAGLNVFFSQSREQFWAIFPEVRAISQQVQGDGLTTNFTGTITNIPFLQNKVLFSSVDIYGNGLAVKDVPITDPVSGFIGDTGNLVDANNPSINAGNINYVTGVFDVTFPTAPALSQAINSQVVPYQAAKPQAMLYYDNKFIFRPVPDQPYQVNMDCYTRPSALLATDQMPELSQWWQYIAYGAAKKIFEDRMDMDSIQMIMPELKNQERLVLRDTLIQLANERTATIYTEQTSMGTLSGGGSNWGGF
jgi:hypothetical protein